MTNTWFNFFTGAGGLSLSSACVIYIVLIMMLISIRMYLKQGKKAYISLLIGSLFIMTYQGLNIHFAMNGQRSDPAPLYFMQILQIIAFIIFNLSIYQLYNRTRQKSTIFFGLLFFGLCLVPVVQLLLQPAFLQENPAEVFRGGWPLSAYAIFLCVILALLTTPYIRQRGKYLMSLGLYLLIFLSDLLNDLLQVQKYAILSIADQVLPLFYFTLLFFILFDRVVELLQSVYRSSITDGLTSLYNRRYFNRIMSHYVKQGLRVSAIFCDIDNFKKLNDTQGHQRADEVLKQVAGILIEEMEGVGIAGRYGGEELVTLVVDRNSKVADIAETIRKRIESETIVTASIGYSTLRKDLTGEELVKQADQAMYHSKTTGKNKVTAFTEIRSAKRA